MSYKLTPFARVALGVMIIGAAGTATYMLSIKQLDRPTVTQAVTSVVSPEPKAQEPSTEGKRNNKIETPSAPTQAAPIIINVVPSPASPSPTPEPSQDRAMDALSNMRSLSNK